MYDHRINPRKIRAVAAAQQRFQRCLKLIDWAEEFLEGKDADRLHDPEGGLSPDQRAVALQLRLRGAEDLRAEAVNILTVAKDRCDFCGDHRGIRQLMVSNPDSGEEEARKCCPICYLYPDVATKELVQALTEATA